MPVSIAPKIERLKRDLFFFGDGVQKNKIHSIKWEVLCKSKKEGGLGIGSVQCMNKGLLNKWVWRFGVENCPLWKRERGTEQGCGLTFLVESSSLKEAYPRIFDLVMDKLGCVKNFGHREGSDWKWEINLRRNLFDWEIEQWRFFSDCLKNKKVMDTTSDSLSWVFDSSGEFSVKSFRKCMEDGNAQINAESVDHLFLYLVWSIWEARNQMIFKDIPVDSVRMEDMIPPATNFLKFNVDGSVRSSPGFASIGGVLRNHLGKDVISIEILVIARACDLFGSRLELVRWRLIIACDSKIVTEWVTSRDIEGSNHEQLISHIRNSLYGFGQASVVYYPRDSNSYADILAKKGSAGCEDVLC
ncbi:hypothetical protein Ddye_024705 [Dipteronia dyeriana]|uniref:RNase H type-1 domain-containing protein n=1 Tax=Dipteronia dyeriana TaxID=168575 RepID=A0AAD9TVV6_9ROSI|nr:hypothetical protein Ddye_024705 [Dipteronia dyeriana]